MRKMLLLGTVVAIAGGLASGCNKKKGSGGAFNCKTVQAKNKKCSAELADSLVEMMSARLKGKIPATVLNKMKDRMKKQFETDEGLEKCKKNFESKKERDVKMKAALEKCFAKSGCKEYASCFAAAVGKLK